MKMHHAFEIINIPQTTQRKHIQESKTKTKKVTKYQGLLLFTRSNFGSSMDK